MPSITPSPARRVKAVRPVSANPRHRANTRFARLIAACGLTHEEASGFLGVSKQTIAMKAAALRPMFREEEIQLVGLWHRISAGEVDEGMPAGARRMQTGLMELRTLAEMAAYEHEGTGPKFS